MSNKAEKKQTFTTYDVMMVVALGLSAIGISFTILSEALRDDRIDRARFGAEALAHQMATGGLGFIEAGGKIESSTSGRSPASVGGSISNESHSTLALFEGALGRDPWGKAFQYKLLRGIDGQVVRIMVWSNGENQTPDTPFSEFDIALSAPTDQVHFKGDDVGFIYERPVR